MGQYQSKTLLSAEKSFLFLITSNCITACYIFSCMKFQRCQVTSSAQIDFTESATIFRL